MITNRRDVTPEVIIMHLKRNCNFYKLKQFHKGQGDGVIPPISTICGFMKHQAICNYNKLQQYYKVQGGMPIFFADFKGSKIAEKKCVACNIMYN